MTNDFGRLCASGTMWGPLRGCPPCDSLLWLSFTLPCNVKSGLPIICGMAVHPLKLSEWSWCVTFLYRLRGSIMLNQLSLAASKGFKHPLRTVRFDCSPSSWCSFCWRILRLLSTGFDLPICRNYRSQSLDFLIDTTLVSIVSHSG